MERQNHMSFPPPTHDQKHSLLHPDSRHISPPSDPTAGIFDRFDRSFKLPLYPPPSYAQAHDPGGLRFPDPPKAELAPLKLLNAPSYDDTKPNNNHLPSLSTLTASSNPLYTPPNPPEPAYSPPEASPLSHWPSLNPLTAYYNPSHAQDAESPMRMDVDASSSSGVSAPSPDRFQDGRASSVSLDDPDVRMAAEALGDLRADFISSPSNKHAATPGSPNSQANGSHSEPLISLLTTSHPLLATTIEGATSAYVSSKNYSPRFKSSAEYVEGYVIPIANTVGSVGRVTGVEGGVRWFLGGGRRHKSQNSDIESADMGSNKRRRVDGTGTFKETTPEPASGAQTPRAFFENSYDRRLSVASTVDTLPAYDELRSPPYAEQFVPPETRSNNAPWQSRLIMSTSGLSIAMSEESLRSLKYCLSWLRWANVRIGNVINALKATMEKYERSEAGQTEGDHSMGGTSSGEQTDRNQLAAKIAELRMDVLKTLQDVINTVSRYAGGSLPENARELVRRHLTSLPQRFRVANMVGEGQRDGHRAEANGEESPEAQEKETRESAQRVLVLAKEGLDMMSQVSGVLDGTIVSAEEWCDRLGRRKREQRESLLGEPHVSQAPLDEVKIG
ncbi:transcription factor Opi1-domain-containing protein [Annulohypoxylon maeteangense]|uniref:transcription factor Opi1-domain-containing protein n=1 Tax=Annulohypoxylon maeteangense TaxID=1927788 RepID=UPI00200879E6|nr:transcription factor Opi1-domain-containing protein [Annulohypoxylon maeteangense]KAI0883046.1 transcription factor Opi1-domain-containing protein [Annulohypoxylon maeteangense]